MQPPDARHLPRMPARGWLAAITLSCVLALSGCAGMITRPPMMTIDQVVGLSKDGVPAAEIIRQLKATRTVLALTGSQYAKLRSEGVPDEVLDFIQQTYVDAVQLDTRIRYQSMYWGWGPVYPYRPYYHYWPYWYGW
ncbi:MAG: hypothetical protein GC151_15945 [Betaproteobacteria bacterium]|nr:hypothetical protein [Betaproteobacteria bacterium]